MIAKSTILFKTYTKYDLGKFWDDSTLFFKNGLPEISNYFNGISNKVKTEYLDELKRLLIECNKISQQFDSNSQKLNTSEFWELLDFFEQIRSKLQYIDNISKYLRSSRVVVNSKSGFQFDYLTGNQETLENVSQNILGDEDSENQWVNIATQNDLKETDYEIDSGETIILYKEKFIQNFVTTVIDNMIGEKIYGLDIDKKITFVDDDLKILPYKETVFQTVNILSNLKKGDIPEYNSIGVNASLYIGSNIANLAYSSIVRELTAVFKTDDLFINFKVNSIKLQQDSFYIEFEVNTKYKLLIESQTLL